MKTVDDQSIVRPPASRYWQRLIAAAGIAVALTILPVSRSFAKHDNLGVFPPDSHPFGFTYGEWGARWWQWLYSIPFNVNPSAHDPTGAQCAINQSGPVWFLAGTTAGTATRACTIPEKKAIFFPIINAINDYPCPEPPPFRACAGAERGGLSHRGCRRPFSARDVA